MKNFNKPDKLSHLKKSLELASIICNSEDYISSNTILDIYSIYENSESKSDESSIKRAIRTIHTFFNINIFESKPSMGYRLKREYKKNSEWLLPLFTQYLFIIEIGSMNYSLESVAYYLESKSLYNLYLFQYSRDKRKTIEFEYVKYMKTETLIKKVNVYSIIERGRKLFILGEDTQNGAIRHYIFTQIKKVIGINQESSFSPPSNEILSKFYNDSLEAYEGSPVKKVILRFSKESEVYIKKEFFHRSQKFSRDKTDFLLLEMEVNNANELFSLIAKFMTNIEIIEPIEWRKKYIENLNYAIQLHKKFQ